MEAEHCTIAGFNYNFESKNYKISTCPKTEWEIAVGLKDMDPSHIEIKRKIQRIEDLMKVDVVKASKLIKEEVIAVVLYTGPMVRFI